MGRAAPEALNPAPRRRRPATPRTRVTLLAGTGGEPRWCTCARGVTSWQSAGRNFKGQIDTCRWRRFDCRQLGMGRRRGLPPLTAPADFPANTTLIPRVTNLPLLPACLSVQSRAPRPLSLLRTTTPRAPNLVPAHSLRPRAHFLPTARTTDHALETGDSRRRRRRGAYTGKAHYRARCGRAHQ